jgi:hypothetical protein
VRLRTDAIGRALWGSTPFPAGAEYLGTAILASGERGALLRLARGQEWTANGVSAGRYALGIGCRLRALPPAEVEAAIERSRLAASLGAAGGRAASGDSKRRGGSDYYRALRTLRRSR